MKSKDVYGNRCNVFGNQRVWELLSEPQWLLCVIHGTHEHSGRYAWFGNEMSRRGFITFAQDLPGHGLSATSKAERNGDLGKNGFANAANGIEDQIQQMQSQYPDLKLIILGHSLGSLLAMRVSATIKPYKLILSGFALHPGPSAAAPFGCKCLNCLLHGCCRPCTTGVLGPILASLCPLAPNTLIDDTQTTHDLAFVEKTRADPLFVKGAVCNRTGNEVVKGVRWAEKMMDDFGGDFPTLILHGEEDTLTFPRGSRELYERMLGNENELKIYPGLYHELLFEEEKGREKVMKDILAFIEK